MEPLWLLTIVMVPLVFVNPEVLSTGFEVPKVTLYRSLVGLIGALWAVELALTLRYPAGHFSKVSWSEAKGWLLEQPTRLVLLAAFMVVASNFISTLLSPSIPVSLWGRQPAFDGYGFYNHLSHFILFAVVATHLKTPAQLWRLFGAIIASGVVVGIYGILQYFGQDPFGIHAGGIRVVSSLGNPIFLASFLLMVVPLTLPMALRSHKPSISPANAALWVGILAILLLTIVFTQARGPWLGLTGALAGFLVLTMFTVGRHVTVRAGLIILASGAITWMIVTFVPPPITSDPASLTRQPFSITPEVTRALSGETLEIDNLLPDDVLPAPSGMKSRFLMWQGAGRLVINRPWFAFEDRPSPFSLYLFGYGPEFFQYIFPLERPPELVNPHRDTFLSSTRDAHNNIVHRTVELGFFGLASYLFLLGALAITAAHLVWGKLRALDYRHKLAMAAVLASIGGRSIEQLVGIPHISDVALFWTLIGVVVALPNATGRAIERGSVNTSVEGNAAPLSPSTVGAVAGRIVLALVLAAVVVGFTTLRNPYYALAETRAAAADTTLKRGDLQEAIDQIEEAIGLAPDVGSYHVTRTKILNSARQFSADQPGQVVLAREAYVTSQRAVEANPYDIYGRLYFAESALTLAVLGQDGKGEEALEEYRRLTIMVPGHWLPRFLLGRAYTELGRPRLAIKAYDDAIRLNPQLSLNYSQRGMAHLNLGHYQQAIRDFDQANRSGEDAFLYSQRGVALYQLGQLQKALESYDKAIRINPRLVSAYNNRGTAYHTLGQLDKAIDDYDEAIRLNPRFAEAYANRAMVHALLKKSTAAQQDAERAKELGFTPPSPASDSDIPK